MRPLTLATPKPLLHVAGRSLLEHQIRRLRDAGLRKLVINAAYLAQQILNELDRIDLAGVECYVSIEEQALETGGGILRALPYLGDAPFLLINSDVWIDIDLRSLVERSWPHESLAHLVLVPNPEHYPEGDFGLIEGRCCTDADIRYTYSGLSIISPALIHEFAPSSEGFPLGPLLRAAMVEQRVSGELYTGTWSDIGTPERLAALRNRLE